MLQSTKKHTRWVNLGATNLIYVSPYTNFYHRQPSTRREEILHGRRLEKSEEGNSGEGTTGSSDTYTNDKYADERAR